MERLSLDPRCNSSCRACHYKSLNYAEQTSRKDDWASTQLSRWSQILSPIEKAPLPERLGYREKSWLRVRIEGDEYSFGMFRAVSVEGQWEQEFVSWDTCPVHSEAIQQMIQNLKRELKLLGLEGIARALLGIWVGSPHLVVIANENLSEEVRAIPWGKILVPPFDRVWFHHVNQMGRKIFGHREIEQIAGPPPEGAHPIRAFRQVAQTLLTSARHRAIESLLKPEPSMVLDLYCGTGEISRLLPPETGWVGIEMSKEAAEYAQSLRSGPVLHRAFVGGVEHRLRDPKVLERIETPYSLYLNPPRSGLSLEAEESLLALFAVRPPLTIVYLSCSASSLARDLKRFEAEGYVVASLRSYDFFPQTEHFETLAVLTKA